MSGESEILADRARREAARGKPNSALSLYWNAWENLTEAERAEKGPPILHAALDLCQKHLEQDAPETLQVLEALDAVSQKTDGRALSVRAAWHMTRAGRLWGQGEQDEAWEHALAAERDLLGAISIADQQAEAWYALGDVYNRIAEWSDEIEDEGRAEHYRKSMLEAYTTGASGPIPATASKPGKSL